MERTTESGAALAKQLRDVLELAEDLLRAIGADRDEALRVLRDRVHTTSAAARASLADIEHQARQTTQRLVIATDDYVREHPWTTVSLGAAFGLVLGSWIFQDRRAPPRPEAARI